MNCWMNCCNCFRRAEERSSETPSPEFHPLPSVVGSSLTIVFTGKSGAGKSTLRDNLLDEENELQLSPDSITQKIECKTITKNGVTISIYDTIGLEGDDKKKEEQLKDLSDRIGGNADLVVYCIPIGPGSKFDDSNPAIMRSLHKAFGKEMWKHCAIALTFSNLAWDLCESKSKTPDDAVAKYKTYIQDYIKRFQEELQKLDVNDVVVKTPFDQEQAEEDKFVIVAIPVGYEADDKVLPGIKLDVKEKWKGFFFFQMSYYTAEKQDEILRFRYGTTLTLSNALKIMGVNAAYMGAMGGAGGAVMGAIAGAAAGAPAGPLGMVAGAVVGAVVVGGEIALTGAAFGGATTGAVLAVSKAIEKISN